MPIATPTLDRVFHALSDPTRLAVVERLSRGPASVSELAKPFDMALPSLMQHLKVLEDCGLATSQKEGRVRTFRIASTPLSGAEDWLATQRSLWERRLDQLDAYLAVMKENER